MSRVFVPSVDRGLLFARVALGVVFFMHGWQKLTEYGVQGVASGFTQLGMPLPVLSAAAITGVELIGGLLLIAGVMTRLTASALAVAMLVATLTVHAANGFFLPTGYEFTLTLMLVSLALTQTGAGKFSIDARLAAARA